MRGAIHLLAGLAMLLISFGATLRLLEYWDESPALPGETGASSQPEPSAKSLYSLATGGDSKTWAVIGADTNTTIEKGTLVVQSRAPANQNELVTSNFKTTAGQTYQVQYDIEVRQGSISLGALDAVNGKWIEVRQVTQRHGGFQFAAASAVTTVVIVNASASPTVAKIASLTVKE